MEKLFDPHMTKKEVNAMSALALAHIGDGVFELLVRTRLCLLGGTTNSRLHRQTVSLVRAASQAEFAEKLLPLLSEVSESSVYAPTVLRLIDALSRFESLDESLLPSDSLLKEFVG